MALWAEEPGASRSRSLLSFSSWVCLAWPSVLRVWSRVAWSAWRAALRLLPVMTALISTTATAVGTEVAWASTTPCCPEKVMPTNTIAAKAAPIIHCLFMVLFLARRGAFQSVGKKFAGPRGAGRYAGFTRRVHAGTNRWKSIGHKEAQKIQKERLNNPIHFEPPRCQVRQEGSKAIFQDSYLAFLASWRFIQNFQIEFVDSWGGTKHIQGKEWGAYDPLFCAFLWPNPLSGTGCPG